MVLKDSFFINIQSVIIQPLLELIPRLSFPDFPETSIPIPLSKDRFGYITIKISNFSVPSLKLDSNEKGRMVTLSDDKAQVHI
jgi:hypothetical protein